MSKKHNIESKTIEGFGEEWSRYDQTAMSREESLKVFNEYFESFPWDDLPEKSEGFDMGCGSGRWAYEVASRVGKLHCIDPSSAIEISKRRLANFTNIVFHRSSVDDPILLADSQDFGYSLGVLHHIADTSSAIKSCVDYLKPGAPFLLYLYYAFEERPLWFILVWRLSDLFRRLVCLLPISKRYLITDVIAFFLYFPWSRICKILERIGVSVETMPLGYYRAHSLITLRTDARDRFGTPIEKRFNRSQIYQMMTDSGLQNIKFSSGEPYTRAIGFKTDHQTNSWVIRNGKLKDRMAQESCCSVSVIIPCYNCVGTIARAIDSVLDQSVLPAEIIVIDDCSTDGTLALLQMMEVLFGNKWFKLVQLKTNSGPSTARNAGISQARFDFIAFLDSDDAWHPVKNELQVKWMIKHPGVSISGHRYANCLDIKNSSPPPALKGSHVTPSMQLMSNRFTTPSIILRRGLNLSFREGKRTSEDYLVWLQCILSGLRAFEFNSTLAYSFKAPFGEDGVSKSVWVMEKGEIDTFNVLRKEKLIGNGVFFMASIYSFIKFVRRILILRIKPSF